VEDLFRGLELLEPGVTLVNRWRPDLGGETFNDDHVLMSGGIAVKP
jgi:hypothetical protein